MESKLTDSDLRMIACFWREKHDLRAWADWNEKKPLIRENFPEIIDAWERYLSAKKTMDVLAENLVLED